jgi:hypothetical protein
MAKKTQQQRDAELCDKELKRIMEMYTTEGSFDDVGRSGSGTFMYPVVDDEGYERYIEITVKIPIGERGGEPYDGYAEAEEYAREI